LVLFDSVLQEPATNIFDIIIQTFDRDMAIWMFRVVTTEISL
jgi:hypothetical protein